MEEITNEYLGCPVCKMSISLTDRYGIETSVKTDVPIFDEIDTELQTIVETFNKFLCMAGYPRNRGYMLEYDLSGEEYDFLCEQLYKFRIHRGEEPLMGQLSSDDLEE